MQFPIIKGSTGATGETLALDYFVAGLSNNIGALGGGQIIPFDTIVVPSPTSDIQLNTATGVITLQPGVYQVVATQYCMVIPNENIALYFTLNGVLVKHGGGFVRSDASINTNVWCSAERIIQVTTPNSQFEVNLTGNALDVFGDQPEGTSVQILKIA